MDDGLVRLHESRHLETILSLEGYPDGFQCVAVANIDPSGNQFLIFCGGYYDNSVRGWEVGLDGKVAVSKPVFTVGQFTSSVWCLAVSSGGSLVAAGCADGQVFIWRRQDGADSRGFELATEFCFSPGGQEAHSVRGVVVSDCGDFVAASTSRGKIAFWSRRGGSDGVLEHSVAECASRVGAALSALLLSKDNSKLVLVFDMSTELGAGCEVWDVASRKLLLPFVRFSNLDVVLCATLVYTRETGDSLFVGGFDGKYVSCIAEFSTGGERKEMARYSVSARPMSLCGIKVGTERKLLVGCADCYFYAIDLKTGGGVLGASGDAESSQQGVSAAEAASAFPRRSKVDVVAVMPAARVVVTGYADGRLRFWKAESGEKLSASEIRASGVVTCIDISGDESWAVSGDQSGDVLVWKTSASTWTLQFDLKCYPWTPCKRVVCVSILESLERIVSVDLGGVLRVWDGRSEKEALISVPTGLKARDCDAYLGAHCLRGRFFLWAIRELDQKYGPWKWKLIDLENDCVIFQKETNYSRCGWRTWEEWEDMRNEARSHLISKNLASGEEEEPFWKLAATYNNSIAQLCGPDAGRSRDLWTIWTGNAKGPVAPQKWDLNDMRLDCVLRSPNASTSAEAALDFDAPMTSIAAAWLPQSEEDDSRRRAVVACGLSRQSHPSIVHLIVPRH